ncbi:MAG: BrnA antitoxin family protein [Bryobacterales bacterium]|nr:BrnA antitoxin family protein [Bryobacterales bacterium]
MKKEYDFKNAKRGAVVPTPPGKSRVTIRLDNAVVDWFRKAVDEAGGGNYQTLINDTLVDYIHKQREPLESTIRRVIREELRRAG